MLSHLGPITGAVAELKNRMTLTAQLEWTGRRMSGTCEVCSHRINWLLWSPQRRQTRYKSYKKWAAGQKNYMTAWSHKCSVCSFSQKQTVFQFEVWPSGVSVPALRCRSEIFCWWCPPPGRQRRTPPGWVRGGGRRFLASTVGTTKQKRHVHTHTFTHRETQAHQHTHTRKNTQEKQRKWRIH